MCIRTIMLATLALSWTALAQAPARAPPYDPYTQCMATVSGIGGFCTHNQFYNPPPSASRSRKRPAYY
jgi:hypothetical protein